MSELLSSLIKPPPQEVTTDVSFSELTEKNFENFNSAAQMYRSAEDSLYNAYNVDPDFNPYDQPEFENYKSFSDRFTKVYNRKQFETITKKIDDELDYYQAAEQFSLVENLASDLLVGISDPINYAGVGGAKKAYSLARGAAAKDAAKTAALTAGLTAVVSETVSQATMETRQLGESAATVAAASLLGGVLGGAVGYLKKPLKETSDALELELDALEGIRSVGAAQVFRGPQTTLEQETLVGALGLEKAFGGKGKVASVFRSPTLAALNSSSLSARKIVQELAEIPNALKKFDEGIAAPEAVESIIRQHNVRVLDTSNTLINNFKEYRQAGTAKIIAQDLKNMATRGKGPKTLVEFQEEVGRVLSGGKSDIPQVNKSAKFIRDNVFEPFRKEAVDVGLLPDDLSEEFSQSYFTRIYNQELIAAERPQFEQIAYEYIAQSQGRANDYANNVSKNYQKAAKKLDELEKKLDDLRAARDTKGISDYRKDGIRRDIELTNRSMRQTKERMDRMSRLLDENRIFASMSQAELRDLATDVTDNILGLSLARTHYKMPHLKRGALKERTFHIPDELIQRYTEKDALNVVQRYTRSVGADIALTKKFGRADMQDQIDEINADYARTRQKMEKEGATAKEFSNLDKEQRVTIGQIEGIRDRMLGTYAIPSTPEGMAGRRLGKGFTQFNVMTSMGMLLAASLPDIGSAIMTHGYARMLKGAGRNFSKRLKGMERPEKREGELAGAVGEAVLATRANAIGDIMDPYAKLSKGERAMNYGANKAIHLTGFNHYVDGVREIIAAVSIDRSMKAIEKIAKGKAIPDKEMRRLAKYGLDKNDAKRVYAQFKKYGTKEDGEFVVNSQAWDDREIASKWSSSLGKEILKANIQPGEEKPLWLSTGLGSVIGQFKSFVTAANQRILIAGLQDRDAEALQGITSMIGLGMLVTYIRTPEERHPETMEGWIREGIDRSGVLAWPMEINNIAEKVTGNRIGLSAALGVEPSSRFNSRNALGAIVGPSLGKGQDLLNVIYGTSTGEFKDSDIRRIRRLIPLQNNMFLKGLFDQVEEGLKEQMIL